MTMHEALMEFLLADLTQPEAELALKRLSENRLIARVGFWELDISDVPNTLAVAKVLLHRDCKILNSECWELAD